MRLGHRLDSSVLALWRMDETSGSFVDHSGNGRDLAPFNSAVVIPGRIGNGWHMNIDGSGFRKNMSAESAWTTALTTGDVTYEWWINLNGVAPPANRNVVGQNSNIFTVLINSTRFLIAVVGGQTNTATTAVPLTGWTHVAIRVTVTGGGTTRLIEHFINGVAAGSGTVTPSYTLPASNFFVGTSSTLNVQAYFDDFRVSSVARKDWEIQESVARGSGTMLDRLGHILDGDTLALWKMNDADATGSISDAGPGGWHMPLTSSGQTPDRGLFGGCRNFSTTGRANRSVASITGLYELLTAGEWTIEGWVNLQNVAPSSNYIVNIGSGILSFFVTSTRLLSTQVGGVVVNSAAGVVPANGWAHVACRVALNGSNRSITAFVNGVQVAQNLSGTPSWGATGTIYIGNSSSTLAALFANFRLSKVARSDADILDSYRRGMGLAHPKLGHATDGLTLAHWKMNGVSGNESDATGIFHLGQGNNPTSGTGQILLARSFASASNQFFSLSSFSSFRTLFGNGDYTIEAWVKPSAWNASNSFIFTQGTSTTVGNAAAQLGSLGIDSIGRIFARWVTASALVSTTATTALTLNTWAHVAVRVTSTGAGTTRTIELFVNGVSAGTPGTGIAPPSGGSTGGARVGHLGTGVSQYDGLIEDLRISATVRSDEDILESYQRGAGLIPAEYAALPRRSVRRGGRRIRTAA